MHRIHNGRPSTTTADFHPHIDQMRKGRQASSLPKWLGRLEVWQYSQHNITAAPFPVQPCCFAPRLTAFPMCSRASKDTGGGFG